MEKIADNKEEKYNLKKFDESHPTNFASRYYDDVLYIASDNEGKSSLIYLKGIEKSFKNNNSVKTIREEMEIIGKPLIDVHTSFAVNVANTKLGQMKRDGKDYKLYYEFGRVVKIARGKEKNLIEKLRLKENKSGQFVSFDSITNFKHGLACVMKNGKYGVVTQTSMRIKPQYDEIEILSENSIAVKKGNLFGIVDANDKPFTQFDYEEIGSICSERIRARRKGKYGFLNTKGAEVVPFVFDWGTDFEYGYSIVKQRDHCVVIDMEGRLVLALDAIITQESRLTIAQVLSELYHEARYFSQIINLEECDKELIFKWKNFSIDHSKRKEKINDITSCWLEKDPIYAPNDSLRLVERDNRNSPTTYGYCDKRNEMKIPYIYEYGEPFISGIARVVLNGKCGIINKLNEIVVSFEYEIIGSFIDVAANKKIARISKSGSWGYINTTGKVIVEPKYDYCVDFSEGLACVVKNSRFGFVNEYGREVIPLIFDYVFDEPKFENGITPVSLKGKMFWIDKEGKAYSNSPPGYSLSG